MGCDGELTNNNMGMKPTSFGRQRYIQGYIYTIIYIYIQPLDIKICPGTLWIYFQSIAILIGARGLGVPIEALSTMEPPKKWDESSSKIVNDTNDLSNNRDMKQEFFGVASN
jgi:hypothetical protein